MLADMGYQKMSDDYIINSFLPAHEYSSFWKKRSNVPRLKNLGYFLYDITCQYEAIDIAAAKVIAAEVIICYHGMLCKWKIVHFRYHISLTLF